MELFVFFVVIANIITFILYGVDKYKAKRNKWRISESTLLWAAVLGGSIGALAAMYGFRHKTKHKKFTVLVPLILILETAALTVYFGYYY